MHYSGTIRWTTLITTGGSAPLHLRDMYSLVWNFSNTNSEKLSENFFWGNSPAGLSAQILLIWSSDRSLYLAGCIHSFREWCGTYKDRTKFPQCSTEFIFSTVSNKRKRFHHDITANLSKQQILEAEFWPKPNLWPTYSFTLSKFAKVRIIYLVN